MIDAIRQPSHLPPWIAPTAAYVHVPFCNHHCGYCDFAVAVGRDEKMNRYLEALKAELRKLQIPHKVDSVFIGGGTPTYLNEDQLAVMLEAVQEWLPVTRCGEFSIEANPATLTREKIDILASFGVNRISLGSQSFQPHLLRVLERDHEPDDVERAFALARGKIEQISLDLIFGVPGQSLKDWRNDIEQALSLRSDHLSTYGLTFEKGTRLWKQMRSGAVQRLDEDAELAMYLAAIDLLEAAGFEHYEISNFALPNRRSRHNQVYWANHAYFGFGMGAARYVDFRRELNTRNLDSYIDRALRGETTTIQSEQLRPEERAWETIALNLRRSEGVLRREFQRQTEYELDSLVGPNLRAFIESGHLEEDEVGVHLTPAGKCVADYVIARLQSPC